MKRMMRLFALALLMCVTAVCLCSCSQDVPVAQTYASRAWTACGRTDVPERMMYMHFSALEQLSTVIETPSASVALIPATGYAYLSAPTEGFDGLTLTFISESGTVVSVLRYTELKNLEETTGISSYLNAANYLAYLYMNARDGAVEMSKDERAAQWYTFTQEQIKSIVAVN